MTKLNDMQSILLSAGAQRENGSLLPAPDSIANAGKPLATALGALKKRGLAEERPTRDPATTWRTDGDDRFGLFITDTGLKAISIDPADGGGPDAAKPAKAETPKPERQTKSAAVVALLSRDEGATLDEIIAATGWLPHTTRAALTGLKKKGHEIEKTKRGDATCYRILAKA